MMSKNDCVGCSYLIELDGRLYCGNPEVWLCELRDKGPGCSKKTNRDAVYGKPGGGE